MTKYLAASYNEFLSLISVFVKTKTTKQHQLGIHLPFGLIVHVLWLSLMPHSTPVPDVK